MSELRKLQLEYKAGEHSFWYWKIKSGLDQSQVVPSRQDMWHWKTKCVLLRTKWHLPDIWWATGIKWWKHWRKSKTQIKPTKFTYKVVTLFRQSSSCLLPSPRFRSPVPDQTFMYLHSNSTQILALSKNVFFTFFGSQN